MKYIYSKRSFLFFLTVAFLSILIFLFSMGLPVEGIFYWLLLIYWLGIVIIFKKGSGFGFKLVIIFYILAILISLFNFVNASELIMRVMFIGLIVSIPQAFLEFLKAQESK